MMENLLWTVGASLALAVSSAAETAVPASCDGSVDTNRKIVLAFYKDGLVGRKPQEAFMRHMAPDFVEHKPEIPQGTREETAKFLTQIIAEVSEARWEIVRTIAEKDMVFLHARFTPSSGAPSYALADIFRVKDCKIVEHWDVVGPPPKEQINPPSSILADVCFGLERSFSGRFGEGPLSTRKASDSDDWFGRYLACQRGIS